MHHDVPGSHGIGTSVSRSGIPMMSWKPCSGPAVTTWRRSTVMMASQKPPPSSARWRKCSIG